MARDVNDIVVFGYGSWSDVYALATLGYGTGIAATPVTGHDLHWTVPENKPQFTIPENKPHYTVPDLP